MAGTVASVEAFDGFGLGLRPPHYAELSTRERCVDFLEVVSENFMVAGGRPLRVLDTLREAYPIALHGVSMSLGSADGVDREYLGRLKTLADRVQPLWVSDHVCWTALEGFNSHDLLPLPYSEDCLDLVCRNVDTAQSVLGRTLVLENPSSYLSFNDSTMSEWEFLSALCRRTGCHLLLDINNVYVCATNHGFDPLDYIAGIPAERVRQIHLAGHSRNACGLLIDTHDNPVAPAVWRLYEAALCRLGNVAVSIERDDDIPPLSDLLLELDQARALRPARQAA